MAQIDKIDSELAKKGQVLCLSSMELRDLCIQYVVGHQHRHIKVLLFSVNELTSKSIYFLTFGNWNHLIELNLTGNTIQGIGLRFLSKIRLNSLKNLYLADNQIDSRGLNHLSKSKLPSLQKLSLTANPLGDHTFTFLSKLDNKNIKDMRLGIKYMPKNQLNEHQLIRIVSCNWPLTELRLRNHLEHLRKVHLRALLVKKFENFIRLDQYQL